MTGRLEGSVCVCCLCRHQSRRAASADSANMDPELRVVMLGGADIDDAGAGVLHSLHGHAMYLLSRLIRIMCRPVVTASGIATQKPRSLLLHGT